MVIPAAYEKFKLIKKRLHSSKILSIKPLLTFFLFVFMPSLQYFIVPSFYPFPIIPLLHYSIIPVFLFSFIHFRQPRIP
jgi:hypothetical protein